jgi:RNA polymerase sigma-70 factor (ECF subfamily)
MNDSSQTSESFVPDIDARMQVLRDCTRKLEPRDYELVQMRYDKGLDIQAIADRLGRSAQSVYKRLARIHDALLQCIRRNLRREELA